MSALRQIGIQPDILLVRADRPIPSEERRKLSLFCNVRPSAVIQALDVANIYDVPVAYHQEGLDDEVLAAFGITDAPMPDLARWHSISNAISGHEGEVTIAIVGKYTGLKDAYKSLVEALHHGGIANTVKVNLEWIESETLENVDPRARLDWVDGILVPGGFGKRGSEGMINAAGFARLHKVPFLGICFGMQLATVEAARNVAGIADAGSTEFGATPDPIVGLMTEWVKGNQLERRNAGDDLGGTMRLGALPGDPPTRQPYRRHLWRNRDFRAAPASLRDQHQLSRPARAARAALRRAFRTGSCRRRWSSKATRGSSGSSITPSSIATLRPAPAFASFIGRLWSSRFGVSFGVSGGRAGDACRGSAAGE